MDNFCTIIGAIVLSFIMYQIAQSTLKSHEEKQRRITRLKEDLDRQRKSLKSQEDYIKMTIKHFFSSESTLSNTTRPSGYIMPGSSNSTYDSIYSNLKTTISNMKYAISELKQINTNLVRESTNEDQSASISRIESQVIPWANHIVDGFKIFSCKVYSLPSSKMMNEKSYGKINKAYWDSVCAMQRNSTVCYISRCDYLLNSTEFDNLYAIDIEEVLNCIWFFATEKTLSFSDFDKAKNVFLRIYKNNYADFTIADLYAKKKMGSEDAIRDSVRNLLKQQNDSHILTMIASSLMWMNAYQTETMVLQHMLTTGKEMTEKTQERLHSLTNGCGKSPSVFDVKCSISSLYFDVSALAWNDEEYIGLFENLAFQDKALTYSLAVRDESKDLFIPQSINVPNTSIVLNKFKSVFAEEYGSIVVAQPTNCIALSGSSKEQMDGILVFSNEYKQMGILIHIAKIGKKLIIKFYTLFMPTGSDLTTHKQQALSIYKKLSPSVTMWESSLKDTILMAIEQLLNTNLQTSTGSMSYTENSGVCPDKPIF